MPTSAEGQPGNRLTALAINIERSPRTSPPANLAANPTHQAAPAPRANHPRLPSAANSHPFAAPVQLPSYNPMEGASALFANRLPLSPDTSGHPLAGPMQLVINNARESISDLLASRRFLSPHADGHPLAGPVQLGTNDAIESAAALLTARLPLSPDAGSHPLAARQRLTAENPRHEAGSHQLAGLASRLAAQPLSQDPTSFAGALFSSMFHQPDLPTPPRAAPAVPPRHGARPPQLESLLQHQAPRSSAQILQDWATECRLSPETIDAWQPLLSQEDSRPFASLLARLNGCASFRPQHRAESVQELGSILELAAHNDAYRALCFNVCGGADANCHDNVDVIFGNLRLAARDPSYRGNAGLHEILDYHNRCVPWTLIDDFVSHRFAQGDLLEKVLALRIRLPDILPITTPAMLHGPVASIDDAHELEARSYINAHLGTPESLLRSLSRSPAWRPFLEQRHPVEFVANTLLWDAALQDLMAKPAGGGSAAATQPARDAASFGSRTKALAQARAMPGIGTGKAFQHLQENATALMMETMTRRLVADNATAPSEADAHAALLNDSDWLAYLQKEHPQDPAFSSAGMDAGARHEQLMRLTRQEIAGARGSAATTPAVASR
ncbi:NEL domain-containing protein [Ralstonia syzygii subsp. celebesensis]|uniref:Putative type III effector protein n=1 Tax=blood disease bacterium R229 TaxID=741978 RepID=G2ZMJ6_9RALS|nr:NEL domain-containing protein [Ralstonia syzygii]CCA79855.1 putative type III effector protein [blood disease bacterium R229]